MGRDVGIRASPAGSKVIQWSRECGSNVMGAKCQRTLRNPKIQEANHWRNQRYGEDQETGDKASRGARGQPG